MCSTHVGFLLTITLTVKFRLNLFGVYYKLEENPKLDNISFGNFRMRSMLFLHFPIPAAKLIHSNGISVTGGTSFSKEPCTPGKSWILTVADANGLGYNSWSFCLSEGTRHWRQPQDSDSTTDIIN